MTFVHRNATFGRSRKNLQPQRNPDCQQIPDYGKAPSEVGAEPADPDARASDCSLGRPTCTRHGALVGRGSGFSGSAAQELSKQHEHQYRCGWLMV
jgi:hypothetical protein